MKRFSNILVVMGSDVTESNSATRQGVQLARSGQARLTLMSVIESPGRSLFSYKDIFKPEELAEMRFNEQKDSLAELAQSFDDIDVQIHVAAGKDFIEIIRRVVYQKHDLLIKMAKRRAKRF